MQTKQLQIPIEMILELISSGMKTQEEYWDEAKEIDGIKDYDSLEPVLRITEYINSHLNTRFKCGSFRIMRYYKEDFEYRCLDGEYPRIAVDLNEFRQGNSYYVYFEYKNEHFFIDSYCEWTKYIMGDEEYTPLDLDGNKLGTVCMECDCSEGYYSIECLKNLAFEFSLIDEETDLYKKELEKLDFSKDISIDTFRRIEDEDCQEELLQIVNNYRFPDGKQIEALFSTNEFWRLLFEDGFQALVEDEKGSFRTAIITNYGLKLFTIINNDIKVQDACRFLKEIVDKEEDVSYCFAFSIREKTPI